MNIVKSSLKQLINNFAFMDNVYAHCDVPCGIYDPSGAKIAAKTVKTMVSKILDLEKNKESISFTEYTNSLTRFITTKEIQAELCKKEILILWTDYFKPESLMMFPNLHEVFWKCAKLCSKNKQSVDLQSAEDLVNAVAEIESMFIKNEEAKKAK